MEDGEIIALSISLSIVAILVIIGLFFGFCGHLLRGPPGIRGPGGVSVRGPPGKCICKEGKDGEHGSQIYINAGSPSEQMDYLRCTCDGDIYIDSLTGAIWQLIDCTWVLQFYIALPSVITTNHVFIGTVQFDGSVLYGRTNVPSQLLAFNTFTSATPVIYITGVLPTTIDGIAGGVAGKSIMIINLTNAPLTISNMSGAAIAANRIDTLTGADIVTVGNAAVQLIYNGDVGLWIVTNVYP